MGALIDSSHFRLPLVQIASSRVRDSLANNCLNGAIEKSSSSDLKVRVFKEFRKSNCDNIMCESEGQTEEQRVKFLCSFGGSILPRPSDGKLRYVGGETRIVCVNRDISYSELMFKMTEFYDQALTLKYQLPEEDLDALVSVLCDDDLANMMDEYDKLEATDGFTRLRVFLFSAVEYDVSPLHEETDPEQRYVDALNRVPENGESRRPSEISVFGPAESFDSFNCAVADNGSVQRGQAPGNAKHVVTALPISPKQPLFHIASPPRSPLKHHPHPASALNQHRQPAIHLGEPDQYYQEQSWESGSHVHVQDFICLASTGLSVMPLQEPYQDSVTVTDFTYKAQSEVMHPEIHHGVLLNQMHKQSVEVYASNDEYCGNLQQVDRQEDIPPFIEVSDRCWEEKPIPDILSLQVHMHQLNLLEQPHMHPVYQAVGHCPGEVLEDQEFIPQRKPVLHPMESSRVYDGLEWKQEQCPLGDDEIETSWHAPYYASGLPISPEFSSSSQSAPASDFCLRSTAPTSRIKLSDEHEMYLESQPHIQVIWAPNCGIPEANYESRADHGSNQWSGQAAPLTSHPNSSNYLPTEKHVRWHHQPPFIGEEPRLKGQNVNHLDTFEGSSASKCLYASIKLRENLSEVTGLKTYVEHVPAYPNQHGSSGVESQILESGSEYHPMMVEELSRQNASAKVDQLEYSTEHMRSCTSYEDRIDRAVGCDVHQRNGDGEEFKNSLAERAPGVVAVEEGMNKDARKSDYLEHNSRRYYGLPDESYDPSLHSELYMHASSSQFELCTHVPLPVDLQTGCRNFDSMISRYDLRQGLKASGFADSPHNNMQQKVTGTRLDHASVFPLEHTDEENPWSYSSADKRNQEINLAQNDGKKVESLHGFYTSHDINAADVCSVPAYMLDDVFPKRIENTFGYEGNLPKEFLQDMGSKFIKEIEDINAPFVPPYFQMHPQRGIHAEWTPDAFVTLRSNDIPSSSAYSCAITSSRVILPDSLTFSSSTGVLPSLSSSHPTSNILTTTILPIYDQSPASSANITVPEDLWSENDRQKQFNESKESEAKAAGTAQLVEDLISHKGVARQDQDLDNKMLDNCLNDRPEVGIHSTFRYMDSPVHSCGPLCSSITPTSKIEGNQASTGSAEKTIYEEVKAEPKSDAEEGLMEEKAPEGHSLGFGEDSQCTSVNMAKNDSSVSETEILAQGLQIVRNDDLEEIRELGSGTYGTVYYGKWKGSDVAIKRIKASCFTGSQSERERMIADFWREARILGQLHHPNVVAFYGIVRDGPGGTLATVTEYMVNGSLKQVLHKKDRTIDRRKRLIIAMDAAFGMEYLHGKNIVHFDLKCDNLLVNMRDPHRPVCKIGDLGLSKVKQRTLVSGGVRGTLPWMAPELLSGKSGMVTDKIDVYSFGIVMWELLTGDEPYANMHCGEIIGGILSNTLRPSIPSWCDPAWRSLMEKCWASDPGQRPSFSDIAKELRAIAASINLK